jgi:protein-disulfide isomerase
MWRRIALGTLGLALALGAQVPATKKPAARTAAAPAAPVEKSGLNKQYLEAYLRHLFLWSPQIKVEIGDYTLAPAAGMKQTIVKASFGAASEQLTFYVSADGKYIFNGTLHEAAANPFKNEISKITTALQPSFGAPGAPVTLVVFSDFQCPHCREEAKELRENITKTYPTQVRVYFKDYPLANHDWARPAAIAGRCLFRQSPLAFWDYHDWVFDKQQEINAANFREKLAGFVKGREIDPLQLNQCIDRKTTEPEIEKSIAEARSVRVNSTPTMFMNGRRLGRVPWANLKQFIDFEIDYQKTAKNAGEQECCEVRLPTPFAGQK